jgi:hypothetical protein
LIVVVPPGSAWAKEAAELARLDAATRGMNAELLTADR